MTSPPQKIEPWIHYNFPGRGDTYSSFKWHWQHFNGTDWDQRSQKNAIFKIIDPPETYPKPGAPPGQRRKDWAPDVDDEHGNADFLMFSNIDYTNAEVRQDVLNWGQWMVNEVGVDGFRLDAVQHYSWHFAKLWIDHVKNVGRQNGRDIFMVGEFWQYDINKLVQWTDRMGSGVRAYDPILLSNISRISLAKLASNTALTMLVSDVDLRKVFRGTLVEARPENAVVNIFDSKPHRAANQIPIQTVVRNHDTQPGQATETYIAPLFRSSAYALILLRAGGLPCVFYGDMYGTSGPHSEPPSCYDKLPSLILARRLYAYGEQMDYFDSRTSVGWTRLGTWDRKDGCAVVMSISGPVTKRMYVGFEQSSQKWSDVLENVSEEVMIDEKGYGRFPCMGKTTSVFVNCSAAGRDKFPPQFNVGIYN